MMKSVGLFGICALLVVGCGSDAERLGGEGQSCYPNHTCDVGLTCVDSVCVAAQICGDGVCSVGEVADGCPEDCSDQPSCGDGICNAGESVATCPVDCTPRCDDGVVEGAEACDGAELGPETCVTQGYSGGVLACSSNCLSFDFAGCSDTCGDGVRQGGEVCDGEDVDGDTCVAQGFAGGPMGCVSDCTAVDLGGCQDQWCGNRILEEGEVCDGTALDGATCLDASEFNGGDIGCATNCGSLDWSGCWFQDCGNVVIEGEEVCDGTELGGETCINLGFTGGGVVTCDASCMEFDTSACLASPCDQSGDCMSNCMSCAMSTVCAMETLACQNGPECQAVQVCIQGCTMGNMTCLDDCRAANPVGGALMDGMYECILCQACPVDCSSFAPILGYSCQ
jgi:hypothetical protein